MEKQIFPHQKLILIPSWGNLLGYPIFGSYRNHKITNITFDPVIFISNLECSIPVGDDPKLYLFGMGFYYNKFQIDEGKYIIDSRRLTGLVFSDFVQNFIENSKDISMMDKSDVILKEMMYKIPLSFDGLTENQESFIRGVLNREMYMPYKEMLSEFVHHLKDDPKYRFSFASHAILSATQSHYNQILISESIPTDIRESLVESTAGISNITIGANFNLSKNFSEPELNLIQKNIIALESEFRGKDYDSVSPYQFFQASNTFKTELFTNFDSYTNIPIKNQKDLQSGIFVTSDAKNREIPWNTRFPRRTLESWGIIPQKPTSPPVALTEQDFRTAMKDSGYSLKNYRRGPTENQEQFELNIQKKNVVSHRPLPPLPNDSVKSVLLFLKGLIDNDYESKSVGEAFDAARDVIRTIAFHTEYVWEMSKIANLLKKEEPGYGIIQKEKNVILNNLNAWIYDIIKTEENEKQRIKLEKLEQERLEKERIEKEQRELAKEEEIRRKWKQKISREKMAVSEAEFLRRVEDLEAVKANSYISEVHSESTVSSSQAAGIPSTISSSSIISDREKLQLAYQDISSKILRTDEQMKELKKSKPVSKDAKRDLKVTIKELKAEMKSLKKEAKVLQKKIKKSK